MSSAHGGFRERDMETAKREKMLKHTIGIK